MTKKELLGMASVFAGLALVPAQAGTILDFTVSYNALTISQTELNANGIPASGPITYSPAGSFSFGITVNPGDVSIAQLG